MKNRRPKFRIDLEHTAADAPAVVTVRRALKTLWRGFGLKAVRVEQLPPDDAPAPTAPPEEGHVGSP